MAVHMRCSQAASARNQAAASRLVLCGGGHPREVISALPPARVAVLLNQLLAQLVCLLLLISGALQSELPPRPTTPSKLCNAACLSLDFCLSCAVSAPLSISMGPMWNILSTATSLNSARPPILGRRRACLEASLPRGWRGLQPPDPKCEGNV